MRCVIRFVACAMLAISVAGCDPTIERRYITEGAGIDLYTSDRASQNDLLNAYIGFVCVQAGPSCGNNWTVFVQAGMNDIDLRCDGFLTWIDARRRDREPVLAEISAINTAVHAIMTVTGSSPKSLDIVTAAFGLASATYNNWNSRLLIAVNQSTIQDVVYTSQGEFRDKIKDYRVPDQAAAIYLLRNYLRLCMPTTIEAAINTTTTLVQRGDLTAAKKNLVVKNTQPPRGPSDGGATNVRFQSGFLCDENCVILSKFLEPNGVRDPAHEKIITDFLVEKGIKVRPGVFINTAQFVAERAELVRRLRQINLIP